jgi:hypothetical protein
MKENKLIAEFMGMEHCYRPYGDGFMEVKENSSCVELEDLQYHTSWDWLMPVVEKIFSLGYHYEIKPRYMMIKERMSSEVLVCEANFKGQTYNKSQKEIIYNAVVEFINEYNEENESND